MKRKKEKEAKEIVILDKGLDKGLGSGFLPCCAGASFPVRFL